MGSKAERLAARQSVGAYHESQLAELLSHVEAAIDRYRSGEVDACAVDEIIHHYHRAAVNLWKFCFSRSGGSQDEYTAGLIAGMAADGDAIDWWEDAKRQRRS